MLLCSYSDRQLTPNFHSLLKYFVCRHVSTWGVQNRVCLYPEKTVSVCTHSLLFMELWLWNSGLTFKHQCSVFFINVVYILHRNSVWTSFPVYIYFSVTVVIQYYAFFKLIVLEFVPRYQFFIVYFKMLIQSFFFFYYFDTNILPNSWQFRYLKICVLMWDYMQIRYYTKVLFIYLFFFFFCWFLSLIVMVFVFSVRVK